MCRVHLLPRRHCSRLQEHILLLMLLLLVDSQCLHHYCLGGSPCHDIGHGPLQVNIVAPMASGLRSKVR